MEVKMGRIVLVVVDELRVRPAIVTEVRHNDSGAVDLNVQFTLNDPEFLQGADWHPTPVVAKSNVPFDPNMAVGTWHWPPRA